MPAGARPTHRVLPRYFVPARYGTLCQGDRNASGWQPFGVQHARMIDLPFTVCGLGALGWRMFWEPPFPDKSLSTCESAWSRSPSLRRTSTTSPTWVTVCVERYDRSRRRSQPAPQDHSLERGVGCTRSEHPLRGKAMKGDLVQVLRGGRP